MSEAYRVQSVTSKVHCRVILAKAVVEQSCSTGNEDSFSELQ